MDLKDELSGGNINIFIKFIKTFLNNPKYEFQIQHFYGGLDDEDFHIYNFEKISNVKYYIFKSEKSIQDYTTRKILNKYIELKIKDNSNIRISYTDYIEKYKYKKKTNYDRSSHYVSTYDDDEFSNYFFIIKSNKNNKLLKFNNLIFNKFIKKSNEINLYNFDHALLEMGGEDDDEEY